VTCFTLIVKYEAIAMLRDIQAFIIDKKLRKSTRIVFTGRLITMVENSWPIDLILS
jgi:hypothetical protein